jgi:chemotaxis signal transduction protein
VTVGELSAASESVATHEAVIVVMGAGRFAVELPAVAEVGRVPALTRLPGAPDWLAGVANWRGRLLPVLDLRGFFGSDRAPLGSTARLVVISADGVTAALAVDAVEGTGGFDAIDELPTALAGAGAELLAGQFPTDRGPVAVLDPDAVLRLRDELPGRRRATR